MCHLHWQCKARFLDRMGTFKYGSICLCPIGFYHQFFGKFKALVLWYCPLKVGWNTPYTSSLLAGLKSSNTERMNGSVLPPPSPSLFVIWIYQNDSNLWPRFFWFLCFTHLILHIMVVSPCVLGVIPLVTLLGLIISLLKSCYSFNICLGESNFLFWGLVSWLYLCTQIQWVLIILLQHIKIKYSKSLKLASGINPSNCWYHLRQSLETLGSHMLLWDNLSTTNEGFWDASKEPLQCLQNVGYEGRCVCLCVMEKISRLVEFEALPMSTCDTIIWLPWWWVLGNLMVVGGLFTGGMKFILD